MNFSHSSSGTLFSHCCCSDAQSCPFFLWPHDCSTPGFPVSISWNLHKLMSIELMMPYTFLLPSSPSLPVFNLSQHWVFSSESDLHIRWEKYWVSASASVLPMKTQDWSPLGGTGWISLQSEGLSRVFSNTTVQKHQFFGTQPSSQSNSHVHTWPQEKP